MKRQTCIILSAVLMIIFSTTVMAIDGDMGLATEPLTDGSSVYPYLIEDFNDFQVFADEANSDIYWTVRTHTRLDCEIDLDPGLTGRQIYTTAVIAPDYSNPFNGVFDGNDYIVKNLTIDTQGAANDYLALFGYVKEPNIIDPSTLIQNLGVVDCSITGSGNDSSQLAAICGVNYESRINNCYATGVISNGDYAGGICGLNQSSGGTYSIPASISNCYSHVEIDGTSKLGGLCGSNSYSNITNCYATGNVGGGYYKKYRGGLVGSNNGGDITNCFATGNVNSTGDFLGGLCGENSNGGRLRYCYATGSVDGGSQATYVGGLCGANSSGAAITNCYATGSVSNADRYGCIGGVCGYQRNDNTSISYCYATGPLATAYRIGGICGTKAGSNTITDCYWDSETCGAINYHPGGTGKTTDSMQQQSTFIGWNFASRWWINEARDYPKLEWQPVGDFDNNGRVNLGDLGTMSTSWLTSDGEAGYNRVCELSGDTTIDMQDLILLMDNWFDGLLF